MEKKNKVKLVHLKGCEGCSNSCQFKSLNSIDGGLKEIFSCNTVNFKTF